MKGHEFRYSIVKEWTQKADTAMTLKMERGTGFKEKRDGLCRNNVFALYTHVHADGTPEWAEGLVNSCRQYNADK